MGLSAVVLFCLLDRWREIWPPHLILIHTNHQSDFGENGLVAMESRKLHS